MNMMKLILILTTVIFQDLTQMVQASCSVKLNDSDVKYLIERVLHKKSRGEFLRKILFNKDILCPQDFLKNIRNTKNATSVGHNKREMVAFSASKSKSQSLSAGTVIIFDKEWTNIGKGYNKNTGIFTAPVNGVYQFTSTVMVRSNKALYVRLYHNNIGKTSLYLNAQPGDNFNANTLNIILQVKKGDTVSIKSGQNSQSIHSNTNYFNSFSGYLI